MSVQSTRTAKRRTVLPKEARREQIIDAAIDVFAGQGYRVASITDIIRRAGVARGTFYLYFGSKEEAFNAALDRFYALYREMAKKETARNYSNPFSLEALLREALVEWLRFLLEHRQLTKIVFRQAAAVDPDYEKKYLQIMKATQAHSARAIRFLQGIGLLRRDLDPEFLNTLFYGVTIQIVLRAIADRERPDLEAIADQWIKLLRSGVLNAEVK